MARKSSLIPLLLILIGTSFTFSTSNAQAAPGAAPGATPGGIPSAASGTPIDISTLGAKPGADAASALTKAWEQACASTTASKIVVPKGNYTLTQVRLTGPCKAPISIEIAGNFEAPKAVDQFKKEDMSWVKIEKVSCLTITGLEGGAVFDGKGEEAWKCLEAGNCKPRPINLELFFVNDSMVEGVTSVDSKQFHWNLVNVYNLTFQKGKIIAPDHSPNTDGIHIGRSTGVRIIDTIIETGDDCISIGDDTKNLTVEKVSCGPGHGISVGSLGRYENEKSVENINVKGCSFKNTDNGLRIKTWLDAYTCPVSEIRFEDITMDNVTNPILIDQAYCPAANCDATHPSKVKISNVYFKNIKGTANNPSLMRLVCSSGCPCENIHLEDIDLKYTGSLGTAVSECCNVKPITAGTVNPPACTETTSEAKAAKKIWSTGKAATPGAATPGAAAQRRLLLHQYNHY